MIVLGCDPGWEQSSLVVCVDGVIVLHLFEPNTDVLAYLSAFIRLDAILVIEQIESMGMAVGKTTFETVFWSGRFAQAWLPRRFERVTRHAVKLHLCGQRNAKDANIRQALIDRFGPSTEQAIGKKAAPGPLYGVTAHKLSALAVALTWYDQHKGDGDALRPGVLAEF
mgnify:CR=1 FL=1